jgi:pimeloyl-ACP methyl ester carboxylesterase
VTGRSRRFTRPGLEGVALHALHRGDPERQLVVLLHGGAANVHWWEPLAEALASRFHVVALDFRGHGDSDFPEALEVGAFSKDLEALLEELGSAAPILIGHSLGGRVALEHAAGPGGIRALVLLDVARGATAPASEAMRRALGLRLTYRSREAAVAKFRFLPPALGVSEERRRTLAERSVLELPDGRFAFKFDPRWFGVPSRPLPPLARVACPTLVVRGSESTLLSEEGAREYAAAIPGAELVIVKGAGHHVHLDQPDAVRESLERFLAKAIPPD